MSYIEDNRPFITNSKLEDFRFCQFLYKLKYVDEVVPESDSLALKIGSALDDLLSTPDEFWNNWMQVSQEIDIQAKVIELRQKAEESHTKWLEKADKAVKAETKEKYKKEAADRYTECMDEAKELESSVGKRQITATQFAQVAGMIEELKRHPLFHFEPANAQKEIVVEFRGRKLKARIDQLNDDKNKFIPISDLKSSGGIRLFMRDFKDKYIRQLAFYQLIILWSNGKLHDGEFQVAVKENPPKSIFFKVPAERLQEEHDEIVRQLELLIRAEKLGIFSAPQEDERLSKCFDCDAYGVCPHAIQKKHFILS